MWTCKHCNKEFNFKQNPKDNSKKANHSRWCKKNPKHQEYLNMLEKMREKPRSNPVWNKGKTKNTDIRLLKQSKALHKRYETGDLINAFARKKHTQESKQKMSKSRKKYIQNNRNKHNWSLYRGVESGPEKLFRLCISRFNVDILQYYIPPENDRLYELDFADIKNKMAFEINGGQHYNKKGELSKYYKKRHNYFIYKGWTVVEIYYTVCYNKEALIKIINNAYCNNTEYSENITKEIVNHRNKKRIDKIKVRSRRIEERKAKKEKLINERKKILDLIDTNKFGWVYATAKKWNISHTQVRRWINKYYPDSGRYERRHSQTRQFPKL